MACGVCDDGTCTKCKSGFVLEKPKDGSQAGCIKCSDLFINCVDCNLEGGVPKCLTCDTQIANMNSNGECLECKPNWYLGKDKYK